MHLARRGATRTTPQPAGPGFPEHAPSVYAIHASGSARALASRGSRTASAPCPTAPRPPARRSSSGSTLPPGDDLEVARRSAVRASVLRLVADLDPAALDRERRRPPSPGPARAGPAASPRSTACSGPAGGVPRSSSARLPVLQARLRRSWPRRRCYVPPGCDRAQWHRAPTPPPAPSCSSSSTASASARSAPTTPSASRRRPLSTSLFAALPARRSSARAGPDVGLPPGQMGNSEVGHLNFGAGRIAMMDISRIDNEVHDGTLGRRTRSSPTLVAQGQGRPAAGCTSSASLSDGGVHSSLAHLFALVDLAQARGRPGRRARVPRRARRAAGDGAEVPRGARAQARRRRGRIGTVVGPLLGAWTATTAGSASSAPTGRSPRRRARAPTRRRPGIEQSYADGKTDEFVEPFVVGDYDGVAAGDAGAPLQLPPRSRARAHARAGHRRLRRASRATAASPRSRAATPA